MLLSIIFFGGSDWFHCFFCFYLLDGLDFWEHAIVDDLERVFWGRESGSAKNK